MFLFSTLRFREFETSRCLAFLDMWIIDFLFEHVLLIIDYGLLIMDLGLLIIGYGLWIMIRQTHIVKHSKTNIYIYIYIYILYITCINPILGYGLFII